MAENQESLWGAAGMLAVEGAAADFMGAGFAGLFTGTAAGDAVDVV
jgi:hypothetical protein